MPSQNTDERARPRSVQVREKLTQRIDSGMLAAGSRLPSEPALATELGVSRATLREALRALETEGLVRRLWGAGTFVADGRRVTNSLDANFGVTDAIRAAGMQAGIEQAGHSMEPAVIRGVGKSMRMRRVIDQAGVSVICALDHGMTSPQFLEPLADIATRTAEAVAGGANVIMMSKGMVRLAEPSFAPTTSLALLLSASGNPEQGEPEIV